MYLFCGFILIDIGIHIKPSMLLFKQKKIKTKQQLYTFFQIIKMPDLYKCKKGLCSHVTQVVVRQYVQWDNGNADTFSINHKLQNALRLTAQLYFNQNNMFSIDVKLVSQYLQWDNWNADTFCINHKSYIQYLVALQYDNMF